MLGASAFWPITHPILKLLVWKLIYMYTFQIQKKNYKIWNIALYLKIYIHINCHTNSSKIGCVIGQKALAPNILHQPVYGKHPYRYRTLPHLYRTLTYFLEYLYKCYLNFSMFLWNRQSEREWGRLCVYVCMCLFVCV